MLPDNLYNVILKYKEKRFLDREDESALGDYRLENLLDKGISFDAQAGKIGYFIGLTEKGKRRLFLEGIYRIFR